MKIIPRHFLLILCLTPFLVQCVATKEDVRNTYLQVDTVDREVKELKDMTVRQMQERQAMVGDRLDQIEAEILNMKGKLEENTHFTRLLREENKELQAALNAKIIEVEKTFANKIMPVEERLSQAENRITEAENKITLGETRMTQAEKGIEEIKQARATEAAERAMEAARAAERARKAESHAPSSSTEDKQTIVPEKFKRPASEAEAEAPVKDKTEILYEEGLALYQAGNFRDAIGKFTSYLEKYPKGSSAPNARYRLADSLFSRGEYEISILEFQKVVVDFPQHNKAPAALLKQGMAFEKLQDNDTAKLIYKKVVTDYSDTDQAKTADSRLKALK